MRLNATVYLLSEPHARGGEPINAAINNQSTQN